jgi:sugar phosphate isomerase/epimerase
MPDRKFTMALTPGSIGVKADQKEAIELAHYFGFESVEAYPKDLGALPDAELKDMREGMEARHVAWAMAGLPVDFRRDEERFREGIKDLPGACQALQRAGVTRLTTWISPMHESLTYAQNFKLTAGRLREIATVANDHGLRFGLEYVGTKSLRMRQKYPFVHTMAGMKELIAEIGKPHVGFVLDSWHWWTADETAADILTLTNHDVISCDLNDAPKGIPKEEQQDGVRELPGATGEIDIKAFLGALLTIGYDGPIRAEPFSKAIDDMDDADACATVAEAMRQAFALVA